MNKQHLEGNSTNYKLDILRHKYALSMTQIDQLNRYLELLIEWNKKFNLTAITNPIEIITYHFDDSLTIAKHMDFSTIQTTADIGTGAGFPGIPLKIMFPHLHVILIEVNNKKRSFLSHIAQELSLDNIIIYPFDWRTFLRTHQYSVDYFFARASLQPEELIRVFKPSSTYKHSTLIYWASQQWVPGKIEAPFIKEEILYTLDTTKRKLVFFTKN